MWKTTIVSFVSLLIPGIVFAAPSISSLSGTFQHGQTITIIGSGFGTKSPAKPMLWCDFEDQSVGPLPASSSCNPNLSQNNILTWGSVSKFTVWTSDNPYSRSTKNAYNIPWDGSTKTSGQLYQWINGSKYFFYARRKWPSGHWGRVSNQKVFHAWNAGFPEVGNPASVMTLNYHNFSNPFDPDYHNQGMKILNEITGGNGNPTQAFNSKPMIDSAWIIEEVQGKKASGPGVVDGKFKYWYNGDVFYDWTMSDVSENVPDTTYGLVQWTTYFQFWADSPNPKTDSKVLFDDLYMDKTWSRVMIGNASAYDSSTHREPLIPLEWSNTSITTYFNQGSFQNGSNVYVFVVDSSGNASLGKAVKIGGTFEGSLPPDPPLTPSSPTNIFIDQ